MSASKSSSNARRARTVVTDDLSIEDRDGASRDKALIAAQFGENCGVVLPVLLSIGTVFTFDDDEESVLWCTSSESTAWQWR